MHLFTKKLITSKHTPSFILFNFYFVKFFLLMNNNSEKILHLFYTYLRQFNMLIYVNMLTIITLHVIYVNNYFLLIIIFLSLFFLY